MKAASDYGALTESIADLLWSQRFKEPPSVWGFDDLVIKSLRRQELERQETKIANGVVSDINQFDGISNRRFSWPLRVKRVVLKSHD
ncbi:hypothetical protein KPL70_011250 [Citrus sinensis]|nr:hypothetical protein KPL70_011250 [Citrus sinensis]